MMRTSTHCSLQVLRIWSFIFRRGGLRSTEGRDRGVASGSNAATAGGASWAGTRAGDYQHHW